MATNDRTAGLDHPTVVPENFDPDGDDANEPDEGAADEPDSSGADR